MLSEWFQAAVEGRTDVILHELCQGTRIDRRDEHGETALMLAVQGRRINAIEALIEGGASLELQNELSWTAMTYAVIQARGWVIYQGICWSSHDIDSRPMGILASAGAQQGLREAVLLGDTDLARRICNSDTSLDFSGSAGFAFDQTYLMLAAHLGEIAVVRFLLSRGAKTEGKDDIGRTALMRAAEMGHLEVVSQLLDCGASVNAGWPDETAFSAARRRGHESVCSLLRSRGAKLTLQDAVETSDVREAAELLREGAVANQYVMWESRLERLVMHAVRLGNGEIVALLLAHGASLDMDPFEDRTLLAEAARLGHVGVVRELIACGADVDAVGRDGLTASRWASIAGHDGALALLRRSDATQD